MSCHIVIQWCKNFTTRRRSENSYPSRWWPRRCGAGSQSWKQLQNKPLPHNGTSLYAFDLSKPGIFLYWIIVLFNTGSYSLSAFQDQSLSFHIRLVGFYTIRLKNRYKYPWLGMAKITPWLKAIRKLGCQHIYLCRQLISVIINLLILE